MITDAKDSSTTLEMNKLYYLGASFDINQRSEGNVIDLTDENLNNLVKFGLTVKLGFVDSIIRFLANYFSCFEGEKTIADLAREKLKKLSFCNITSPSGASYTASLKNINTMYTNQDQILVLKKMTKTANKTAKIAPYERSKSAPPATPVSTAPLPKSSSVSKERPKSAPPLGAHQTNAVGKIERFRNIATGTQPGSEEVLRPGDAARNVNLSEWKSKLNPTKK